MMELMAVVNEQDQIRKYADKKQIHHGGWLHRSVHIFIINSRGELFCRQINTHKEIYPGYWSTSVGAHVMKREHYNSAAKRSLVHNLGITCALKMIGKVRVRDRWENEISATYIGVTNQKLKLNQKEAKDGRFMPLAEIKKVIRHKNVTPHLALSLEKYEQYLQHTTPKG